MYENDIIDQNQITKKMADWINIMFTKTIINSKSNSKLKYENYMFKEIGLLNSFIWSNTNVRNSKQILHKLSKYYRIHPNGLIKQIPNLQNFVSGNGPFLNSHYCYSTIPKQDFKYISENLYLNMYLDVEFVDDSNIKSSIESIEKIMKSIILQDKKLSFYQRIYSIDLFLEY
jgi:hypothetical protein